MCKTTQWLCVIFLLVAPTIGRAQEWVVRYDGPVSGNDGADAIAVDAAGNIYVAGTSEGSGTLHDYTTVKYDAAGIEQWVARYDGPVSGDDVADAIAVDAAGNIYVTGRSEGSGTDYDYATVKYDVSGIEQWVARYNGPGSGYDWASAIAVDTAGNTYITGRSQGSGTSHDYATVKYNDSGVEQWVARYDGPLSGDDGANALATDAAGNTYVTGTSLGAGTLYDYATVKYDASGVEQWVARYEGPLNGNDWARAIAIDAAGNICVTGLDSSDFFPNFATVKYDSAGVEQWVTRYNGPGSGYDAPYAITVDTGGNFYVTGTSVGQGANSLDYATVKYDASGIEQWVARYNGPGSGFDIAYAIAVDSEGNTCVTGSSLGSSTDDDYATVKYDAAGVEQWVARYDGPGNGGDAAYAIAVDAVGNIFVTGMSLGSGTGNDIATIKYSVTGIEEDMMTRAESSYLSATIFSGQVQLPAGKECKIFDIMGRVREPTKIQPGIYFLEIEGKIIQKVIKVR